MQRIFKSLIAVLLLAISISSQAQITKQNLPRVNVKALIEDKSKQEANKVLVLNFYQEMFGDKDTSTVTRYMLPTYIQHNPNVADGAEAFKKAAAIWFKGATKSKIDVQHIAAEGDLVFIHLKNRNPDGSLRSTIDIFRIENGKIAEHWDANQNVPEHAANSHPMF